jgi:hypothetical protein
MVAQGVLKTPPLENFPLSGEKLDFARPSYIHYINSAYIIY